MPSATPEADPEGIAQRILIVRGHRALLDADLAELYGVRTARLNQQVRRNRDRFPNDFAFLLTINELRDSWLQFATSSKKFRGRMHTDIATRLKISEKTVRNHASNIFDKLGVWSRTQAIVFARDRGFAAPTD